MNIKWDVGTQISYWISIISTYIIICCIIYKHIERNPQYKQIPMIWQTSCKKHSINDVIWRKYAIEVHNNIDRRNIMHTLLTQSQVLYRVRARWKLEKQIAQIVYIYLRWLNDESFHYVSCPWLWNKWMHLKYPGALRHESKRYPNVAICLTI